MTDFHLTALLLWLGDAFLIIAIVAVCCCYYGRRRRDWEEVNDDRRHQEAAAASHAQPAPTAAAVQMAAMAVALLDHVTHPRQNVGDAGGGGGGDDHPVAAEECAICLGQFEDGDRCSVMPGCRHEFHRSCIAKWLMACNNTCPLCRAQLQWDDVAHDMV